MIKSKAELREKPRIDLTGQDGNVIETQEHIGGLKGVFVTRLGKRQARA
jgi:hypothetical protein